METKLALFVKCPLCDGFISKHCPRCDGKGVVPWTPKAAPLVWRQYAWPSLRWGAGIGRWPDCILYDIRKYKTKPGYYVWISNYGKRKEPFQTLEEAKAFCQSHADALVKQLVEGRKE